MPQVWESFTWPLPSYEYKRLLVEFNTRLARNEENPLLRTHRLHFCGTSTFSFLPSEAHPVSVTDISNISPPVRPKHPAFDSCTPPDLKITLSEPIRTGCGRRAQVWKANAFDDVTVVVKIFQACFGESPEWNPWKEAVEDFIPEEEMAHREAWSYCELAHLQGTLLPHSYGFFDIKVPSGDVVCAHVLEFIEGLDLDKLLENLPWEGEAKLTRTHLANHLVETVIKFRRRHLTHGDLEGRNIICPNGSIDKPVIIDFGSARDMLHSPDKERDGDHIWILLVTILGWRGAQNWVESKAEECMAEPVWREILLDLRETDEWEPYTERDWQLADMMDNRRIEKVQREN